MRVSGTAFIDSLEKAKAVVAESAGLPSKSISECYALIGLSVRAEMLDRRLTKLHVTPHTLSKSFRNCGLPKPASRLMTPHSINGKAFMAVMQENHDLAVITTRFGTLMFIDLAAEERSTYNLLSTTSMQTRLNFILDALRVDKIKSSTICVLKDQMPEIEPNKEYRKTDDEVQRLS